MNLTEKSIEKLKQRAMAAAAPTASVQDVFRLFGFLSFCTRVLRVPAAAHYTTYKFIRRLATRFTAGSVSLDSPAGVWPCARPDIDAWIAEIVPNIPVRHVDAAPDGEPIVMVTDASTVGWGAILADERSGNCWQVAGKWPARQDCSDINTLEMLAVRLALQGFLDVLALDPSRPLILLADNSSTAHVLRRGMAREHAFNAAALSALQLLAGARPVSVAWIRPTKTWLTGCLAAKSCSAQLGNWCPPLGPLGGVWAGPRGGSASRREYVPRVRKVLLSLH